MTQDNQIYHRPPAYVDGEQFSNDWPDIDYHLSIEAMLADGSYRYAA